MARADRRRDARARPAAAPSSRYESAYVGTSGLFFERLRRQAKWIFVVIALLFAVGFVGAGVGSDVQGGIFDIVGFGSGNASGPSVGEARDRVRDNPKDAKALLALSEALRQDGKPEEAIRPLERYTELRPRDQDAVRELATLYLTRAQRLSDEAANVQLATQELSPGGPFGPDPTSLLGQALVRAPVTDAVSTVTNERVNQALAKAQLAFRDTQRAYQQLADLTPDDAQVQLQLANAALNSQDTLIAVKAFKRFLQLAPDDPLAPVVKERLQQLEGIASTPQPAG